MEFFGKSLASKQIEVNENASTSDDPEMLKRIQRIETNYAKLGNILNDLEQRFEMDDRLAAVFGDEASESVPKKPR